LVAAGAGCLTSAVYLIFFKGKLEKSLPGIDTTGSNHLETLTGYNAQEVVDMKAKDLTGDIELTTNAKEKEETDATKTVVELRGHDVEDSAAEAAKAARGTKAVKDDTDLQTWTTSVGGGVDKDLDGKAEIAKLFIDADNVEQLDAIYVFRWALVFNACLESFAHGSNDTANATGPFSAVYQLYTGGSEDCDSDRGSVWILCVAGLFVALGVSTFGYGVINTIGKRITVIDFHKGFFIELGSTLATMLATILELPVSTTHCQVGGVIGVGLVSSAQGLTKINWREAGKIVLSWIITLPISGSVAAIVVLMVKGIIIDPQNCTSDNVCPA